MSSLPGHLAYYTVHTSNTLTCSLPTGQSSCHRGLNREGSLDRGIRFRGQKGGGGGVLLGKVLRLSRMVSEGMQIVSSAWAQHCTAHKLLYVAGRATLSFSHTTTCLH